MKDWKELIASGLLELYVTGETSSEEDRIIAELVLKHVEVRNEIDEISLAYEKLFLAHEVKPDPVIKPFLMAKIDYITRLKGGERFSLPPLLHKGSVAADYAEWLNRKDMVLPDYFDDVYAKIIGSGNGVTTAIVWIRHMAPQEVHDREYEKFLILEGTCIIYIENDRFELKAGDYLTIPLHKKHHVLITSGFPCKAILQRVAA